MKKLLTAVIAIIILIAGLITFPMPLPTGAILIAIGILLLATISPWTAAMIKKARNKYPKLDTLMRKVKPHTPDFVKESFEKTDPML